MTGAELITIALTDGLNVQGDGTFPYAEEANDRLRAQRRAQAILNDLYMGHDWLWRRNTDPQTMGRSAGNDTFQLPGDFSDPGSTMTCDQATTGLPVRRKDPQTVQMLLDFGLNGTRRSGLALVYSVEYSFNEDFGDIYSMRAAPRASQDETVIVNQYLKKPPEFLDDDVEIAIPERFHESVLLRLVRREFQKSVGDARDTQELQEIQGYIEKAWRDERPRNTPKRSPRYGRPRTRNFA